MGVCLRGDIEAAHICHHVMVQAGGLKKGTEFLFINYIRIFFQNAADEAPAVGMEAVGFVADEYVSGPDGFRINQFAFFTTADAEAGEFHDGFRHHTGHFRRFPSGQDAVAGFQVVAHAGHQAGDAGAFPFQIGDAQIIQEKERVAARGKNVVDVHGHQVFAGGFHHVQFKENFRLGAYAVAPGDDDRFLIGTQIIGSGEKAKGLVKGSLFLRSFNVRADVGYKSGCFFGIDPRLLVG